jgi:hypothetical protein
MATIDGIVMDLRDCADTIRRRPDNDMLHTGMVNSICQKITTIRVVIPGAANRLYDAVSSATYPSSLAERLHAAIDSRLSDTSTPASRIGSFVQYQVMSAQILNYFSSKQWQLLEAAQDNERTLVGIVASHLCALNVRTPSEHCLVRWAAAIVVHKLNQCTNKWPSYRQTYSIASAIKAIINQEKGKYQHLPFVGIYPEFPQHLPKASYP